MGLQFLIVRYDAINPFSMAFSLRAFKYCFVTLPHWLIVEINKLPYVLIFALTIGSFGAIAQTKVKTPKTIRMVTDGNYAPYSFQSDEDKLWGILIDQWQAWEKKTGIKVDLQGIDWSEAINRSGRYLTYAGYAVVVAILLIAGLIGWNRMLRKAVLMRTAALGESDLCLRQIAENIREVFWMATPDMGNVLYVSPAYESVWGRSLESLRQQPQSFHEAIHPEDREQAIAILKEQREHEFDIEYRIVRPDRSVRWIRDRGFPVKDNSGKVYRIARISEDITERKEGDDTLRKSIRDIINAIPTMAWTVEPDGTVDFVNQFWLDYAGLSLTQHLRIVHPEDLPDVLEKWRVSMAAGEPSEGEMRLQRADGEYRWFLVRTAPLHDEQGNLVKWYGVSIDIEDSKRLADALRESEQRYISLFENLAEGVAYFRMLFKDDQLQDAIYLAVNPAWEVQTGLRNVIGRKISEVLPGILEAKSEFFDRSVRVALTGQSERFEAYSSRMKKWFSASAYCPKKEHVIVVLDDITERKQAEEKLKQFNSELHSLSSHLQNIQENERTAIAREIHDELGQLLTGLKMEVGWLNKKLPDDPSLKEKGKEILSLVSEMLKTVKRIAMDLRPNILDELGLIAALEWQGQEFEKSKEIKFQFHTNLNDFNPERNLSTNIFRVHQEALTNIARHAQATRIETTLEKKGSWLRLMIKDNGKGFDVHEEKNKNSFGLIGMKERALMLRGKLVIESVKRKGTVITLKVPLLKTDKKGS